MDERHGIHPTQWFYPDYHQKPEKMDPGEYWRARRMVARLIPKVKWEWYAEGLLRADVFAPVAGSHLSIHIWSDNIGDGYPEGSRRGEHSHNHLFDVSSMVLAGAMSNTESFPTADKAGTHEIYKFNPNSAPPWEPPAVIKFESDGERYLVRRVKDVIDAGHRYEVGRDRFHISRSTAEVSVTLVTKSNMRRNGAALLSPRERPPDIKNLKADAIMSKSDRLGHLRDAVDALNADYCVSLPPSEEG